MPRSLFLFLLLFAAVPLSAQVSQNLVTDAGYSAEVLVKDIFAASNCETISNVKAIGPAGGIGYFENGMHSVGLDRGIILATGQVENAPGPNNLPDVSGNFNDHTGDKDLKLMAEEKVNDAVGIEFDFVPLDSIVTFRYVFASDEYCEFVGSVYNDVFGFFVSGPGINGEFTSNAANVALVPGTNDFVAINSINRGANPGFYIGNERKQDQIDCGLPLLPSPYLSVIQYDGFTTVLTAKLVLQPCETYHIRLVISDVGDTFYDSAVFLEAGSFDVGETISLRRQGGSGTPATVYEGCEAGYFRFERDAAQAEYPVTVNYKVSSNSEAEEGVDFLPLAGSITIPAGATYADLPVTALADTLDEGPEELWLALDIPCACYTDSVMLVINEAPPLDIGLKSLYLCPQEEALVDPAATGGVPPYLYEWSNGLLGETPLLLPPLPDSLHLRVTDACGQEDEQWIRVKTVVPPSASLLVGEAMLCEGQTVGLPLQVDGVAPFRLRYTRDGVPQPPLDLAAGEPLLLPVNRSGTYQLISIADAACEGPATGKARVSIATVEVEGEAEDAACTDSNDGSIALVNIEGQPPFTYRWSPALPEGPVQEGLAPGHYQVMVTDAHGCRDSAEFRIGSPPPLSPLLIDCNDLQSPELSLSAGGGTPPYRYSLDGWKWEEASLFNSLPPGRKYDFWIRDANGCQLRQTDFYLPQTWVKMADLPEVSPVLLGKAATVSARLLLPLSQVDSVYWQPAELFTCPTCLETDVTARQSQEVTLTVVDRYGCSQTLTTYLQVDERPRVFIPNAFSPNADGHNDRLVIYGDEDQVARIVRLRVFDRWGALVYEELDSQLNLRRRGWDGTVSGKGAAMGVYVYELEVELINGTREHLTGDVLLIR